MDFHQMLAAQNKADEVLAKLRFPTFASPKLDGIRGTKWQGQFLSRNLRPHSNKHIHEKWWSFGYDGYDGEFICGDPTAPDVYRKTASVVNSGGKSVDNLLFHAFDFILPGHENIPYYKRAEYLRATEICQVVQQHEIHNMDDLLAFEEENLNHGYEGLILRDPMGRYKYGRSTLNEGLLLKLKRFCDGEAVVIGFEEKMHNANEKTLERNGKATRSSHKAGLVPLGTLGALVVRWHNLVFNIGSGFTAAEAQEIWNNREKYLGRLVKFKYFPIGMKDLPRHPTFVGWPEAPGV